MAEQILEINRELYDHMNPERSVLKSPKGINEEVVRLISKDKNEPEWMLQKRLQALKIFQSMKTPTWGPDLSKLDLNEITYYTKVDERSHATDWDEVPEDIKRTFEKLGIPEVERKSLAGAGAQYDSMNAYHNLKKEWAEKGVIFEDCDTALKKYPELFQKYFMTQCVPIADHKFAALHAAVWSGGTFIYVPKGVKVTVPLQAYFRINAGGSGQFEHTLIIVDEGAEVSYIEGCFTKGNIVHTNPDYKPIEEIKQGQKVLTHDGSYKKVKEIYAMPYEGTIKNIKLWGALDTIDVTEDHPFLYVDRKRKNERNKIYEPRWNLPRFFKKGDYLAIPINKTVVSKDYYEVEIKKWVGKKQGYKNIKRKIPSTKEFFKLAGYYLSEGSISSGHYLNFSFSDKEVELMEDVKHLLKKVFNIEKVLEMHHKKNNGTSLVVCSTELCRIFEIFGKKANKKNIPQWMMLEDQEKQKCLIESYFNGDGNYYKKPCKSGIKEVLRLNSVSEKLTKQCRDILLRLGIVSFINARDRSKENRQTMYTLGITGEYMSKFGEMTGIKIHKKLNGKNRASMFGINKDFAFFPIKEINSREVKDEIVYNFSVEANETYCVAGAAAHNCSAPQYNKNNIHAGCVEIYVKKGARVRYSSIENWSKNTYNLNTKRAIVEEEGIMEWINGNLGSGFTMLYPSSILKGKRARTEMIGIAFAGNGQNQDTGSKVIHIAPDTSSTIIAKSISKDGGITTYRGLVKINKGATNAKSNVECDALMVDNISRSDTIPYIQILENKSEIGHEARTGKISQEKIFYLMSRGLSEEEAKKMIVSGFIEPITKQLPGEYAIELNRLIELEMEGSLG